MSPSGPKADRLLCAIEMLKRSFASTQSRGRYRPKSVIGRLLSHSRKQTFAVLPHRQDCAQAGHSRPLLPSLECRRSPRCEGGCPDVRKWSVATDSITLEDWAPVIPNF